MLGKQKTPQKPKNPTHYRLPLLQRLWSLFLLLPPSPLNIIKFTLAENNEVSCLKLEEHFFNSDTGILLTFIKQ